MRRPVLLGVLVLTACAVTLVWRTGSCVVADAKPQVSKIVARAQSPVAADATARSTVSGDPHADQHLANGLQALLSFNAGLAANYPLPADTTKPEEKKEQVKKSDRQFEAQPKDGKSQSAAFESTEDDDEGFWDSCFAGCMGVFVESLCSGVFGDDEVESVAPEGAGLVASPGVETPLYPEVFPYAGVMKSIGADTNEVAVWEHPSTDTTTSRVVATLPAGARVTVFEEQDSDSMTWARVKRIGSSDQLGWVWRSEVVPSPTAAAAGAAPSTVSASPSGSAEPRPDIAESKWQISAGLSYPLFGQQDIRDEYGKNAFRVGIDSHAHLAHSMQIGGTVSYLRSSGENVFAYAGPTTVDSPVESRLEIWEGGLSIGQLLTFAGGRGFFLYGIGPSVFNVREQADIEVYEGGILVDTRQDELSEWKFGGAVELSIGGVSNQFPIALQTRFMILPWEDTEEKSLTLDYLKTDVIYAFSFGVTVGIVFF